MDAKSKLELPTPPTFSQMMEDLDIMTSDDKIFKLFQLEQLIDECDQSSSSSSSSNRTPVEQTYWLINKFLSRLKTLQDLDTNITAQNDASSDEVEKKLRDIINQLQMCLTKLQTNSFSNVKNVLSDNK
ncbi:unnamed protein product [Adineta ricciae]|uniref:Uncharacterized protein n=1 Tax=Adineta ricciae TaxID=249248 RepID=A0A814J0D9_ADIRI|nr:unnamed protein product [Adineta ricciae]